MSGNTSQPSPEKILCILCIDVNNNLLMLDFEPVSYHPAMGLFQASRPPALPGGSYESETIGNRQSCRDLDIP